MALWFEVISKQARGGGAVGVHIRYFDDQTADKTVAEQTFEFSPGTTIQQALDRVTAFGNELRSQNVLYDAIPVGYKAAV